MKYIFPNKPLSSFAPWTILLVVLLTLTPVKAQQYSITWSTVSSSGGTGVGGNYTLDCTLGLATTETASTCKLAIGAGYWPQQLHFVDLSFLTHFTSMWLQTAPTGDVVPADFSGDNIVNLIDYSLLSGYWTCYCPLSWR
ncbi:MAG: hypothetical protein GY869_31265 [Planctomycetes bacterium]|nr:hypothetical protein [Planctomycetota bacterium]